MYLVPFPGPSSYPASVLHVHFQTNAFVTCVSSCRPLLYKCLQEHVGVLANSKEVIPHGETMGIVLSSGGRKPCPDSHGLQLIGHLSQKTMGWARAESGTHLAPVAKGVEGGSIQGFQREVHAMTDKWKP